MKQPALVDVSVLILFFNRPAQLEAVFRQVKLARPARLYLYQDGPRGPHDMPGIEACRRVVDDVDIIFGAHVAAECEPGHFYLRNGATHAAVYGIEILIHGIGGHGGFPYQCTDNVMIGAEIVCALNSIVAKNIDPCKSAVITITSFTASQVSSGSSRC